MELKLTEQEYSILTKELEIIIKGHEEGTDILPMFTLVVIKSLLTKLKELK